MKNEEYYIKSLQKILKKTGWTQAQLAQELGVTFATVNRWIKGHRYPQPLQRKAIDRIFRDYVGLAPINQSDFASTINQISHLQEKCSNIQEVVLQKEVMDEFLLELSYHSNAIEGSTLNMKETEAIIFDHANVTDKTLIEHLEAINHASVLQDILQGKISGDVSEEMIKNIHARLMQGIRSDAGQYASTQRGIRGVDLALPHPDDIPEEMIRLMRKINVYQEDVIFHAAQMHADFEAIHPFGDGNGRVGRLIMIVQLLSKGFSPAVMTVTTKSDYYNYLEYAQRNSAHHLAYYLAQSILRGYEIISKYQ